MMRLAVLASCAGLALASPALRAAAVDETAPASHEEQVALDAFAAAHEDKVAFRDTPQFNNLLESAYLFVAVCFMYALKGLGSPESSRRGNFAAAMGMFFAIAITMYSPAFHHQAARASVCFGIAAVVGVGVASRAEMIMMPQMVAAFHAMVGLAAVLVAYARYFSTEPMNGAHLVETMIGVFFGALTLTGSIVAAGKLHGSIGSKALMLPGRHFLNLGVVSSCVALTVMFARAPRFGPDGKMYLLAATALPLFLGWHLVMSIGGADMPVVVSMLNSYSGWTTVAAGFMLDNDLLIIAGSLIGSSGAILSYIMCVNMNRSFISVIAGGFGVEEGTMASSTPGEDREHTETSVADLATELFKAKSVIIVPGYGMAVARCQGSVAGITEVLRANGCKVRFGIHPVAGRLPGHMNVLLAEANVPYNIVEEMEKINDDFPQTDVSIVCGANDIVNPLAGEDLTCPIGGMPVLEVWKAKKCVVMKRSMATGYAGVDNPLFYKDNVDMLFGNAKTRTQELLAELQKMATSAGASSIVDAKTPLLQEAAVTVKTTKEYPPATKSIGIITEGKRGTLETRVAITPNLVEKFRSMAFEVVVQQGAGDAADFPDRYYITEGCTMLPTAAQVVSKCDVVCFISPMEEADLLALPFKQGAMVVGYFSPLRNADGLQKMAARGLTSFSMDAVPRTTVAQKLDALSSTANLAGYKAVIDAFHLLPRFSKPLTTAAGSVAPAKVFVIGAGVAGLSAIGTARSLGAQVKANDTRAVVKEQVESMGAEFAEVDVKEDGAGAGGYAKEMSEAFKQAQLELYDRCIAEADVVITTAAIPGRDAPKLVRVPAVRQMRAGSVVVDLAAKFGGNCPLTKQDQVITDPESGVQIIGHTNFAALMAAQASELYAANLGHLFKHANGAAGLEATLDKPDDTLGPAVCTHKGQVVFKPVSAPPPPPAPKKVEAPKAAVVATPPSPAAQWGQFFLGFFLLAGGLGSVGFSGDQVQLQHTMAFMLAIVLGYFLVWSVDAALHTPLMSVTNAISGIILLGALVQLEGELSVSTVCALLGTTAAAINIFGGFFITHRMLKMFVRA